MESVQGGVEKSSVVVTGAKPQGLHESGVLISQV